MSNPLDIILFDDKTSSDIFKEIYHNSKKKDKQINSLISELKPLITDAGNANVVVPLIKEYLEIGVKNDDALIKMATLVQRALSSTSEEGGLGISDEEKQQLLDEIDKIQKNNNENCRNNRISKR